MTFFDIDKEKIEFCIEKYIRKNKINHAYLIETNCPERVEIAKILINKILNKQDDNNIEELNNNYDLQIITTESQSIKKEEIISLKEKYKTKSIYNKYRVYIIEEAEKLNTSSANTLLKFLEEPEDGIIAILITKNKNLVIDTIVSRCQIIRVYTEETNFIIEDTDYYNSFFQFLKILEKEKIGSIAYANEFCNNYIKDRKQLMDFFKNYIYAYSDILYLKINFKIKYFDQFSDLIEEMSQENTTKDIRRKINFANQCLEKAKYNVNIKLLLDKFIILISKDGGGLNV